MKKVLFAAFAGICVMSSIMATPAVKVNVKGDVMRNQFVNDTVPDKKDTTTPPHMSFYVSDTVPEKKDTVTTPHLAFYVSDTVPDKKDTTSPKPKDTMALTAAVIQ